MAGFGGRCEFIIDDVPECLAISDCDHLLVSFVQLTSKSSLGAWPLTVTSPFAFAIVSYMVQCKYREHTRSEDPSMMMRVRGRIGNAF